MANSKNLVQLVGSLGESEQAKLELDYSVEAKAESQLEEAFPPTSESAVAEQ